MSFNFYLFRGLRLLLFPFALLAGLYIAVRNFFYDKGWLRSARFNLPLIGIGNLSVGGTGKSPTTEYLLRLLGNQYSVAVLSRGYKRKTTGYLLAGANTSALEIGDEPMQFYKKFPEVAIAVGEERVEAIPQLLHDRPQTQVVILDDVLQHRAIEPGFNILLTDASNPYWFDTFLPTGDLRDSRSSARRADIILVTKCPAGFGQAERQQCLRHIKPLPHQQVYFTEIAYGMPYHIVSGKTRPLTPQTEVLLVCGIANPLPLKQHLEHTVGAYFDRHFEDHHIFSIDDWKDITHRLEKMDATEKMILTTEKDAVRLEKFGGLLHETPLYVIPIRHQFLFDEGPRFDAAITRFIDNFPRASQ